MKIKFENSGEVPLDKYPVGTIILENTSEDEEWPYKVYWIEEIDGIRYLENEDNVALTQEQTGNWMFKWVALEVEE